MSIKTHFSFICLCLYTLHNTLINQVFELVSVTTDVLTTDVLTTAISVLIAG